MILRPATAADQEAVWRIFQPVLAAGETYALDPAMPREAALAWWFRADGFPGVAEEDGVVLGAWFLRPNYPGPGAHIANGGFIVAPAARGRGVGRRMGEHFLAEARRLGFRGVQFNFVVSTNEAPCAFGGILVSRWSARCPARFVIPRAASWTRW